MYVEHFKLNGRPFAAADNHQFFVPNDGVDATVKRVRDVLLGQGSVAVISGGPGVGKSALVYQARAGITDDTVLAWADLRQADPDSFLDQLLVSLGVDPTDGSDPLAMQKLRQAVQEHHAAGRYVTAVVDVSNVTAPGAKRLLSLANLMGEANVPLNLVLMGPHTLHKVLDVPGLIQLRQRVCLRHRVRPLAEAETKAYIADGLRAVGGDPDQLLGDEVPELVFRYVAGVPRLINTLMDAALMESALQQLDGITAELIQQVSRSLGWRTLGGRSKSATPAQAKAIPAAAATKEANSPEAATASTDSAKSRDNEESKPDTSPASEIAADMLSPDDFEKTDVADKAEAERKKMNFANAGTAGVPEMDANDTSATGMLRLEDLDERFAESVFGNE
ncbi:MAG: ExeA family protein [Gammaproteobacteria bacterium]